MKLLDSVMKESQRMNPANLVRFTRYVQKPVTLSDGTHLPAGYLIEAPHALAVMDPELYRNPEVRLAWIYRGFHPYKYQKGKRS